MVWRPTGNGEDHQSAHVPWNGILDHFTDVNCDLLFIFDCCYAGAMVNHGREFRQRCEVLCASNKDERANGESSHSFTNAFIKELKSWWETRGICQIESVRTSLCMKSVKDSYGLKVDPHWDEFTRTRKTPICLMRPGIDPSPQGTMPRPIPVDSSLDDLKRLSDVRVIFKATFEDPKADPIMTQYERFVRWRPSNLESVQWYVLSETRFLSLFEANSCSAIISVPMMLWDLMPKRAAYEFISIARSSDLLSGLPRYNLGAQTVAV